MNKKMRIILISLIIIGFLLTGFLIFKVITKVTNNNSVTVVDKIEGYDYSLDSNESALYKDLFKDLKDTLTKEENNLKDYALLVAKLFVSDFYSLNNKLTKTDIGGMQFIHKDARDNFALKAADTFYKYLENNLNGERKTIYPVVKSFTSESVEEIKYTYNKKEYDAFQISLTWEYDKSTEYQSKATITLIKEDNKLSIVEVK